MPKAYPQMVMPWLNFVPESIYWGIRLVSDALGKKDLPVYIAENGCAAEDELTDKGEVIDLSRVMYMRSYLAECPARGRRRLPREGLLHLESDG